MAREVKVGDTIKDHFSVFEDDGFTKHSGLVETDFAVTVYLDSVPAAVAITFAEIGITGEYEYEFVPNAPGILDIEILILYNRDLWGNSYLAATELSSEFLAAVLAQCEKIDLVPTLGPHSATTGSLMDRMMNKGVAKDYNQGTDSLQAIRDRMG
jgi:hypothetical protein